MRPKLETALTSLVVLVMAAGLAAPRVAAASEQEERSYLSELPPLVDRQVFFGDPEVAGAQISPDGGFISFLKPYDDVMNIWVKKTEQPFDEAWPVTADTERPVRIHFWTQDGRYILYAQDKGGNENFHIYLIDPTAEAEESTGVPPARDLTPLDDVTARIYAVPEATPGQIIVGLNDRDPALHDVYRLDLKTGDRELLIRNDENVASFVTDLDGDVRLAFRTTKDGGSEILEVKGGDLEPVYSCTFEETCAPLRFHKDGKRFYLESNRGDDVDLTRLMLMNLETRETTVVESDPEGEVDFGSPIFSDASEELVGTVYVGDRVRIHPRDDQLRRDLKILRKKLPDGEIGLSGSTEDERFHIVGVGRDVDPGSVYLYDRKKRSVKKLYESRPELPSEHLAPMKPVRYTARDGQRIPAYLTIPRGASPRKLPAVLFPHGGPWSRDRWGYDSFAQFLANRGYVVLQPNFRGSTGYGKAFLNAGNEQWGTGVMQHDLTDAVKYLIEEGIADPDRIAIMGGSYGGYATLAGLAFTPDLYAAGVSIVGPSNIITLLESIPPYWGPIKTIFDARVGDPDDAEDRDRLEEQSPLNSATNIVAPLLVIQGANDPRVKKAESDQIVAALRDLERTVEYIVAPDEGHGFAGRENRLAMMASIEKFLAQHLGGRYQEDMAPEVAERLTELAVDVATVEMPERPEGDEAEETVEGAETAPLPEVDVESLEPVTLHYTSVIETSSGETLTFDAVREVSRGNLGGRTVWRVVTSAKTPAGEAQDSFELDSKTLLPVRRTARQGMVRVDMDFEEDRIHGTIQAGPQEMTVDKKLEAPTFGEDAALELVLMALPLESGYETPLRVYETRMQRVRPMHVRVEDTQTVEVEAGTFDAFRVRLEPTDGDPGGVTYWLTREMPRKVLRAEAQLPATMGGGTMSLELTKATRPE